jgi:single-stranded-DNA-specific exonuclease
MELTIKAFEAVYCIDENEWNGKVSIQLRLKNIK